MSGAREANGGVAGVQKVPRDESFKRPGAIPFLWEVRPGVPKQLDQHDHDTPPPSPPQLHPMSYPPTPTPPQRPRLTHPPQSPKLAPPPPLVRSASVVPGHKRRELFSLSFPNALSFSKPWRSSSPSRFAVGSHWKFWERERPARHSVSSPSGSTLSSDTVLSSETASPRRSTGSFETVSSFSDQ